MFSHLFRSITLSIFSITSSKSSILLYQKFINIMKNRFFITRFKILFMTIHDLYNKFHNKFKFLNLIIIQNRFHFVVFFEQYIHIDQTRITLYFKSTINHFTFRFFITTNLMIKLISNKIMLIRNHLSNRSKSMI